MLHYARSFSPPDLQCIGSAPGVTDLRFFVAANTRPTIRRPAESGKTEKQMNEEKRHGLWQSKFG